jgi:hypothetical protein
MSDGWTWKGAGAPWTLEAPHGVWAVSELRPGGRAELRYAPFDEEGRLPVAPLAIGEFASAGDARLAADLYEAAEPPELPEDLADAFLPRGGETEILAPDGRAFLLSFSGEAVTLSRDEGSARSEWARLDQPRAPGDGPEYARPPGHQEPAELDLAIMLRLVNLTGAAAQ